MALGSSLHEHLDDGRWKPFAVSAVVTLLVAGMVTGVLDAVLLATNLMQHASATSPIA